RSTRRDRSRLLAALPADHDDDLCGDCGRSAAGARLRRRYRDAPTLRDLDRWRPGREPAPDAVHDACCLSVRASFLEPRKTPHRDSAGCARGARMRHLLRGAVLAMALAIVTACAVGPNYRRPQFDAAASYKEQDGWKPSEPGEAGSSGPWWRIFNDEALDELERQIDISNENVKAAAAAFEEAQALVSQARAGFWPLVSASGSRQRTVMGSAPPHTTNRAGVAANWDLDIWGQIRRSTESRRASAQASAAALAAARLSAQAALASDYFELRAQDQLQTLLSDIVAAQERSLKIAENRYRVGVAAKADVVSAQTQLLSSQAQQVNAEIQRAVLEHAIAVLLGQQPAAFSVQAATMRSDVPTVPPGLPSTLLERRPDIAEAERRVAAANAQIGVARSAFFPSLTLSGSGDYTGGTLAKLIRTSNRVWSFGPALAQTVFDGGVRRAH